MTDICHSCSPLQDLHRDMRLRVCPASAAPSCSTYSFSAVSAAAHELPKFWGSPNPKVKVTGVSSGFKEAGKGFYRGFKDGIGGLVTTPMKRDKERVSRRDAQFAGCGLPSICIQPGGVGMALGVGQAVLDLGFKPAAGMFGLFSRPVKGVVAAATKKSWGLKHPFAHPRAELGRVDYERSTPEERQVVLAAYKDAEQNMAQRNAAIKAEVAREIRETDAQGAEIAGTLMQPSIGLAMVERQSQKEGRSTPPTSARNLTLIREESSATAHERVSVGR